MPRPRLTATDRRILALAIPALGTLAAEPLYRLVFLTVDFLQFPDLFGIVREILEGTNRVQAELAAKLVVTGNATLAGPDNIDRPHVEKRIPGNAQLLHEFWIVVEYQLPRVLRSKRKQ